jgi:hypothetical protein
MTNESGSINNLRKKVTKTHELIAVSYHESGHTIYGLLHYMKIGSVTVFNNSKSSRGEGTTNYETAFDENISDPVLFDFWLKSELGLCYAGTCAERLYFKIISGSDKVPKFLKEGSEDDMSSAAQLISKYDLAAAGKKRYVYKQKMLKNTAALLEQYWDDIVLISHSLFDKKRLYYTDIKSLLCKKSKNKSFWKEQFKVIDHLSDNAGKLDVKTLKSIMPI